MRARKSRHEKRTRRRIAVMPTSRLGVVLLCAAVMLVFAGNMAAQALAAGAGALIGAAVLGLASVLAALRRLNRRGVERNEDGDEAGRGRIPSGAVAHTKKNADSSENVRGRVDAGEFLHAARHLAVRAIHAFLPSPLTLESTWERIDQRGRVFRTFASASDPTERGWYRCVRESIELTDCFGFWRARAERQPQREVCIPPDAETLPDSSAAVRVPGGQPPFLETQLDTAMVRPYERGDSLRAISWRQTAHHGQLMSFETAPAGDSATVLLVDTTVAGRDDALAATSAAAFASLRARGERPLVTDGVATAADESQARLFTSAFRSAEAEGETDGTAQTLAAGALRAASAGRRGISRIFVVTTDPYGPLVRTARETFRGQEVLVIAAPDTPDANAGDLTAPERKPGMAADKAGAREDPRPYPLSAALASVVCCIACLVATVSILATLIEPAGWTPFSLTALPLVAVDATLVGQLPILRKHRLVRALLTASLLIAILCAGAVRAVELVGLGGMDLLGALIAWPSATAAGETFAGPFIPLASLLVSGVFDLIIDQWVPVTVSPTGDAALVLIMSLVACLLRALLASRHLRPMFAVLPCVLLAVRLVFMGASDQTAWIPLVLISMLLLIALIRPNRHWITRAVPAALAATALACALAPQTLSLANRIPIDLHISPEAFTTRTVSSFVDLREELNRGDTTTALIYTTNADRPLYLRLSTLDSFDGGTWETGSQASGPLDILGGLFGGTKTDTALDEGSPDRSPLMVAGRLDQASIGPVTVLDTIVTIRDLRTGNLPVPVGTFSLEREGGYLDEGNWRWDADGALGGTGGSAFTEPGMSYRVRSAYLDPIGNAAQLNALAGLDDKLASAIEAGQSSVGPEQLPDRSYRDLPANLPQNVNDIVADAREQGVAASDPSHALDQLDEQLDAMRYLLGFFTDGSFSYTLDTPDGDAADNLAALDAFLERRSGWCVHYASSLAVLGRAMGLSTRVALGYRAQSDDSSGPYRATSNDLHTWTEVYLTGIGWAPFDVTPGAGSGAAGNDGAGRSTVSEEDPAQPDDAEDPSSEPEKDGDPASTDTPEQPNGKGDHAADGSPLTALAAAIASTWAALTSWLLDVGPYLLGVVLTIAILIAPRAIRTRRTKRRLDAVRSRAPHAAQAAWNEMTDTARDVGITWPKSATEEDIAHVIIARIGAAPASRAARDIERLANAACALRYAPEGTQRATDAPSIETLGRILSALADAAEPPVAGADSVTGTFIATIRHLSRTAFPRSIFK